jgi:glycosyltransferase involved in cell wall biosynthesis
VTVPRRLLTIVDPVKPPGQTYAEPVAAAARRLVDTAIEVRPDLTRLAVLWAESDALWIDWCVEHAVTASRLNEGRRKPLFIRVHAFELLEGAFAADIAWENVTALVAVSEDTLALTIQQVPNLRDRTQTHVIPNGIDTELFRPHDTFDPLKIAWVGVLAPKKNPFLALHVLAALRTMGTHHSLFVAGAEANARAVRHAHYLVDRLCLRDRVTFCGHVEDMAAWYRDKGVLLSTSLYESFGLAIGEAGAAGLAPVVFDFPNARALWPEQFIVTTIPEACTAILDARRNGARAYVLERYPLSRQIDKIYSLLRKQLQFTERV